jgi:hypothetical protein
MSPRKAALALLLAGVSLAAIALAGCGRQAELDRPGPFLGKPSAPSAEQTTREQSAANAKAAAAAVADPQAPLSVDEVRHQPLLPRPDLPASGGQAAPPASSAPPS